MRKCPARSEPGVPGTASATRILRHRLIQRRLSTTAVTAPCWACAVRAALAATAVATYRPTADWSFTLAGRYSGREYSTLDNTDNTPHVFGAFDSFTVFDARVHYQINERLSASLGIDNVTSQKYFLYHPVLQRTCVADLKFSL